MPDIVDPVALVVPRVSVVDVPAAVVPGAIFGFLAPEGVVFIVPGVAVVPRSPDCDGADVAPVPAAPELAAPGLVEPALVDPALVEPLVDPALADPLVDPALVDPLVDPEPDPLVAPELGEPVPEDPAFPPLLPVCACANPNSATAIAVASEVTSLFDIMFS